MIISEETITAIKNKVILEDVVQDFVVLSKKGVNLVGLCPYAHKEKTPSFYVSPSRQICKCFGCGKGNSDAIGFLMDSQGMSYPQALTHLAGKYNIPIEEESKVFVKPEWKNKTTLPEPIVKWFEGRGIRQKTLSDMKISFDKVYMPAVEKELPAIQFNYFMDGELINIKSRSQNKDWALVPKAKLILYNIDSIKGKKEVFIVEGECFHPSAEVLTPNGWVRLDKYNNEPVAQYNSNREIDFVIPLAKIKKQFSGNLIEYSNGQKFYSLTTPEHNLVVNHYNTGNLVKIKANEIKSFGSVPRVSTHNGEGIPMSDWEIKLCIAVSADFTIRKEGDVYGCFKKERKKIRICEILEKLQIPFSCKKDSRDYWSVFIRRGDAPPYLFKLFPNKWIHHSSLYQKRLIIDEILFWDGNSVPNRNQIEYSSKEIHNATFIQTIASLVGFCATIIPRKNELGEWYKVSILFSKTTTSLQSLSKNKKEINYNGEVFCLTVPSGMLLVRQNQCISVSGNCDALSLIEAGYVNETSGVVSVPNGAGVKGNNLSYIDNCIHLFEGVEKIYIGTDNDIAGRRLREELAERFGKDRCSYLEWKDKKDGNDVLKAYGIEGIHECCSHPINFPITGTFTVSDFSYEIDDMYVNGLDKGVSIGLRDFWLRFVPGYITVITGISNDGKSDFVDEICMRLLTKHQWKGAYYSPENKPTQLHFSKLARKLTGKNWDGDNRITREEVTEVKNYLEKKVFFIQPEKDFSIQNILNTVMELKKEYGIKWFVIDAWNKLEHKGGSDLAYIGKTLDDLAIFCTAIQVHCFLVAHPRKMDKDKKTKLRDVPSLYDISGSADFFNKCDNGLTVYVNWATKISEIHRQKVKFSHWGFKGMSEYKYDLESSRYYKEAFPEKTNWITGKPIEIPKTQEDAPKLFDVSDIVVADNTEDDMPF